MLGVILARLLSLDSVQDSPVGSPIAATLQPFLRYLCESLEPFRGLSLRFKMSHAASLSVL
jgi:hypothetical protein